MLKKAMLTLCLILVFSLPILAALQDKPPTPPNPTTPLDKFVKLDDVAILRLLYPKETFTYKNTEETELNTRPLEQNYQVGETENHKIAVLSRTLGKFTQSETQELLVMISIDNPSNTPYQSGIHAVLLRLSENGGAELIAKPSNLYRSSATNKLWKPALITDVNFDKQEEVAMLEEEKKDVTVYKIYTWDSKSKDFNLVSSSNPMQTLLSFYANLSTAVKLGIENEQSAGNSELNSAYEKLSPKMQGQQSTDVLRRRLKDTKKVEVNSLKLLIKSEVSALVRIQYRLVDNDGFSQTYEGDYQIKRYNEEWQLDSERLKSVGLAK